MRVVGICWRCTVCNTYLHTQTCISRFSMPLRWLSHRSGQQAKTYVKPEASDNTDIQPKITVFELLIMGAVSRKHVEQLKNIGLINSTTRLHLVGSFYEIYITMHGSMNIKCSEHS